jgi:LPS O-antigen subunit length determinant protein (WzzB/FepE family)
MDEILGKVEGVKPEGQEDLVKKLGELKTKKPEDIKKVSQYVDFINDEKNKDKIVELDKIINAGEGA